MSPEDFFEEVHSFEFWLRSVRGYLDGTEYGRSETTEEVPMEPAERDRLITVLCNYCTGETAALEGAGALIQIAPNRAHKVFLSTQAVDEGRHLEVLIHRLRELGVEQPEEEIQRRSSPSLVEFRRRLSDLIRDRDWLASIFAQNVILESMEFATFGLHVRRADPRTAEILERIIKDERRHIGFGENELGRRLKDAPFARERLIAIRNEFDPLIFCLFDEIMSDLGAPRSEHAELGRHYVQVVERLGFA